MNHWTEEQLTERLYGIGPEEPAQLSHFESCAECQARLTRLAARREEMTRLPEPSDDFLRAQRQQITERIERGAAWSGILRPVPAFATALLLVMGWMIQRPATSPAPPPVATLTTQVSDAQLFSEIASLANSDEPRAASPMRALFVEAQ